MTSYPPVAVVILTYNSAEIIERCLASLVTLNYSNVTFMLVDNDSQDATHKIVKDKFPQVELLQTSENTGYTGGNNRGIEKALLRGADYVLIVNPDTVLLNPNFLYEMICQAETKPKLGIVGPRVYWRTVDCVQNTILFLRLYAKNILLAG